MSTKPPISSLGSAPLMIFSSPAASIPLIQSRRSLLGMFSLQYPDDLPIGFFPIPFTGGSGVALIVQRNRSSTVHQGAVVHSRQLDIFRSASLFRFRN